MKRYLLLLPRCPGTSGLHSHTESQRSGFHFRQPRILRDYYSRGYYPINGNPTIAITTIAITTIIGIIGTIRIKS